MSRRLGNVTTPRTASPRWYAAAAGVAAAAAALGAGEIVAAAVNARSSPLIAVGGVVIDKVPESGKELAIRLFGTYDKLALEIGTVAVVCALAAVLGVLSRTRLWIGLAGFGVFGAIGVAAALTRAGSTIAWAVPGLAAAGVAMAVLSQLLKLLERADAAALPSEAPVMDAVGPGGTSAAPADDSAPPQPRRWLRSPAASRRLFLQLSGAAVAGGAVLGYLGHLVGQLSNVNSAREAIRAKLPPPSGRPASPIPGSDVAGLSYITPNDIFYRIDTALVVPRVDPADWTLTIGGRVGKPMQLSFDELLRRPMIERYITLTCVSNEVGGDLIGNARWLGVPLADLLDEVDPDPAADQVVSWSVDGFSAGTPTAVLRDGRDALLAIAMNGEPLPLDHGFPVRMVVPGLYGYVSATKWLSKLELTTFADYDAYWVPRGWAAKAPIKTGSRIDRPRGGERISAGEYVVAGIAWAQRRGISTVEVRVDEGPWQTATLGAVASTDTWRLWSWRWQATPGDHVLEVRATDNAGEVQTDKIAPPAPDGATGYHVIAVKAS
jgi:DMSO/TMAO reductase YedYZ molybdopterin-dependent catalytic subunit